MQANVDDVPPGFESAAHGGWQFSWAEGNALKLFGCRGYCNGKNCNSTYPGFRNPGWHFFRFPGHRHHPLSHGPSCETLREPLHAQL